MNYSFVIHVFRLSTDCQQNALFQNHPLSEHKPIMKIWDTCIDMYVGFHICLCTALCTRLSVLVCGIIPESPQKDKRHDFGKDVRNSLGGEKNQNALFSALETSPNT